MPDPDRSPTPSRRLLSAELLSVGSELTVGDTKDTNSGELAADLTGRGVRIARISALPDDLGIVCDALSAALAHVDLVVSTGGLGPTPDDLTREAIAAVLGEEPTIDPATETWLRERFTSRGLPFPESNLKQAWLIPSAQALPNPNGSAPGWLVRAGDGRVIVALPGPPKEMRPMWHEQARPLLEQAGVGTAVVATTFRLHGIGESAAAELLGEELLRASDPEVATYARVEAVDIRVASHGEGAEGRVAEVAGIVEERLGRYVWATGATTWAQAIATELARRGWTAALAEVGTGGSLTTLLGEVPAVRRITTLAANAETPPDLENLAETGRSEIGAEVGLALGIVQRGDDLAASVAVVTPDGSRRERRLVFTSGAIGRGRAAITAASILLEALRGGGPGS
jgi:nicotinamide-nucleotide amidase